MKGCCKIGVSSSISTWLFLSKHYSDSLWLSMSGSLKTNYSAYILDFWTIFESMSCEVLTLIWSMLATSSSAMTCYAFSSSISTWSYLSKHKSNSLWVSKSGSLRTNYSAYILDFWTISASMGCKVLTLIWSVWFLSLSTKDRSVSLVCSSYS